MTLQNLFFLLYKPLEDGTLILRCLSTNTDKGGQSTSYLFRGEQGRVTFDDTFSFHALNACIHGGSTQVDLFADSSVRNPPILEQQIQDFQINAVDNPFILFPS